MIKIENVEVLGWEHVIRGMRNAMNSWDKSDSYFWNKGSNVNEPWGINATVSNELVNVHIGEKDHELMMRLARAGSSHAKYRRMITVYLDITAPLYFWKEFDTYKVGTVANSCSTMHKIHSNELTINDFSHERLNTRSLELLKCIIGELNMNREMFIQFNDKTWWEQMIQLLPTSYNQKRTIMLNYEVLVGMYRDRKNHKLDEWKEFCKCIESLPYAKELICGE